jgi:predicted glycoside hydrolase/deacetylase ChbG (UPF0249 family)
MHKTTKLIIHADDLGYSVEVNDAVFALMEKGLITSASLMANAPAVEDACARIPDFPNCSFGIHLNVTEFAPLADSTGLKPLLDNNGNFVKGGVRRFLVGGRLRVAIFDEYCRQVEKLQSFGVDISHINSHHYVHSHPALFGILKKLQRRFGLRQVRISTNIYGPEKRARALILPIKAIYNFVLRRYYQSITTSGFTDFATFCNLGSRSRRLNRDSLEVHVHPGAEFYADETALLEDSWQDELKFPVRLISHHELAQHA